MSWIQKLQRRWNLNNVWQVVVILLVFACTGFTVLWLKKPVLYFFFSDKIPDWSRVVYYILILPIYNLVLLFYGFVFGQFNFFLEFEKRFFKRLASLFRKR